MRNLLGKQVVYHEELYTILFNYNNGMLEIRNINSYNDVKLVNINEITIIEPTDIA